jgi:WD40 repeat protein/energy-coupling factor transporter ATP-binding protein EcfA2
MRLLDLAESRPYPGLRPFRREESVLLFGRDEQVDQLVEKLRDTRFLAVVGTSGCGKSSLVQAGLLPALESGLLVRAGSRWRMATMRPVNQPLRNLAESLLESGVVQASRGPLPDVPSLLATLRRGPLGLIEALRESPPEHGTNVLLLVDQFEEIFRYRKEGDRREADAFVALLLETFREAEKKGGPPVYVVLTMRSDYLGDCALFNDLPEALNHSQFLTPKLTRDQRREAIEGPAGVFGGEVEEPLVRRLLNDMGPELDQLPLMQHVLMQLWCRAKGLTNGTAPDAEPGTTTDPDFVLRLADYEDERIGGLNKALDRHAELIYGALSDGQKKIAQVLFRCLSERDTSGTGESRRDIRRPTKLIDVARVAGKLKEAEQPPPELMDLVRSVVDRFREPDVCFLTPPLHVDLEPETYIDVSHESILRRWGRLQEWLGEEARAAEFYRRLLDTARLKQEGRAEPWGRPELSASNDWKDSDRSAAWARRYGGHFDLATDFLRDSEEAADAADREAEAARLAAVERTRMGQELRVKRRQLAGVVVVAVGTICLALWANGQRSKAKAAEKEALRIADTLKQTTEDLKKSNKNLTYRTVLEAKESARANENAAVSRSLLLATQARSVLDKSPQLGLLLAVEAVESPRRDKLLKLKVPSSEEALRFGLGMVGGRGFAGNQSAIPVSAISPDGRWIATGGSGKAHVWDLSSDHAAAVPMELPGHTGVIQALAFVPPADPGKPARDGRWLVTLDGDHLARLWDLTALGTPGKVPAPIPLAGHGPATRLVVSPGGRRLLTTYVPALFKEGKLEQAPIASLWDLEKPADAKDRFIDLGLPQSDNRTTMGYSFSPDGRWLTIRKPDGLAVLWDLDEPGPRPTAILLPQPDGIPASALFKNVVFTGDSKRVAMTLLDATALIWEVGRAPDKAEILRLHGEKESSVTVVTDTEGRWVVTRSRPASGHSTEVPSPSDPKAGQAIIPSPPNAQAQFPQPPIYQVPASAQVPIDPGAVVRLYDLWEENPQARPIVLTRFPTDPVSSISVSPDRRWLVAAVRVTPQGGNATVQVWALEPARTASPTATATATATANNSIILRSQEKDIVSSVISPDSRWIVTGGIDNLIRLWDLRALYASPVVLRGHDSRLVEFHFTPDGHRLLTAGWDGTARLWDLNPLRPVADPESSRLLHAWPPDSASWMPAPALSSSTRRWLSVIDGDGAVRLWDLHARDPEGGSIPLPVPRSGDSPLFGVINGPDGRWLLTTSYTNAAEKEKSHRDSTLWDLGSDAPAQRPIPVRDMERGGTLLQSSPDGRWLAANANRSSRFDWGVRLFDVKADEPGAAVVVVPPDHVLIGFAAGGRGVVTFSSDDECHLWPLPADSPPPDARPIRLDPQAKTGHTLLGTGDKKSPLDYLSLDRGGGRLVVVRQSGEGYLWRLQGGDHAVGPVRLAAGLGARTTSGATGLGGGGRWLVSFLLGVDQARFWDLDSTSDPIEFITPFPGGKPPGANFEFRTISPDGRLYVNSAGDGSVQLWNLMAPNPERQTPVRLSGEARKEGGAEPVSTVAFSNDGRWLVALGSGSARLWDLKVMGEPALAATLRDHGGSASLVTVTEDRRWVAIANADGAIRLWDLKSTEPKARPSVLRGAGGGITGIVISPDGSRVLATSGAAEVHVWSRPPEALIDKARRVVGRNLTRSEWDQYFPDQEYRKTFDDLPEPPAPATQPVAP